jgi:ferredoxin/coenzyme F420-reducing hydrogenase delta subunit
LSVLAMLLVVSALRPARSHAPADPTLLQTPLDLDWFYLFVHPLQYWTSPGSLWLLAAVATLGLCVLPFVSRSPRPQVARVDPRFCNGCARCADDCPYAAITMEPRAGARTGQRLPRVDADACAACGICAGACPSSTPFRSTEAFVSGIDMPQQTVRDMRVALERALAARPGEHPVVVFGCERAARLAALDEDAIAIPLICVAMLPPSFVEYALRSGAGAIVVNTCPSSECDFRLGGVWTRERLAGTREPHLRASVDPARLAYVAAGAGQEAVLGRAVAQLHERCLALAAPPAPARLRKRADG